MLLFSIVVILGLFYFILRESRPEWVKGYLIGVGIILGIILISVSSVITEKLLFNQKETLVKIDDDIFIANEELANPQDIQTVKEAISEQPVDWEEMNGDVWVAADGTVYLSFDYFYDGETVKGLMEIKNGRIKSLK